ncbi:MAG: substrate-binding domain-containing protein [Propionibacteriales bacterium]|nr:substrate-binding domain-containing protein [Propionibacteriales bacterium]
MTSSDNEQSLAGPGATPRPTLAAVAAEAGVAVSTASLAFSGKGPVAEATRAAVRAAAERVGYRGPDPRAASFRTGRSRVIGVVLEGAVQSAFRDPVQLIEVDAIAERLSEVGYGMLLLPGAEDDALLGGTAMDAAILLGCSPRAVTAARSLQQLSLPLVTIDGVALAHEEDLAVVANLGVDSRAASAELARLVAAAGHSRVAMVTLPLGEDRSAGAFTGAELAAMSAATISIATERARGVGEVFSDLSGWMAADSTIADGLRAGRALLAGRADRAGRGRPTAVIAQSDLLAVGVIRAAEEAGLRVPEDLSVVGFDGVVVDGFPEGRLTTVRQPLRALGLAAAQALLAELAGEPVALPRFSAELVPGHTVAPPP